MAFPHHLFFLAGRLHLHGVEQKEAALIQRDGGLASGIRGDETPRHLARRVRARRILASRPVEDGDLPVRHRRPLPQELDLEFTQPFDEGVLKGDEFERHTGRAVQIGGVGGADLQKPTGVPAVSFREAGVGQLALFVEADDVVEPLVGEIRHEGLEVFVFDVSGRGMVGDDVKARRTRGDGEGGQVALHPLDVEDAPRRMKLGRDDLVGQVGISLPAQHGTHAQLGPDSLSNLHPVRLRLDPELMSNGGDGQRSNDGTGQDDGASKGERQMHAVPIHSVKRLALMALSWAWSAGSLIRQAAVALMVLSALLLAAVFSDPAAAHELRPAIATVVVAPDGGVEVGITLNLEAAMAGIEPDHSDTKDSANAPVYDELRELGADGLRDAYSGFEGRFLEGIFFTTEDGTPVDLSVASLDVPEAPNLALARHSEVTLEGRLPDNAEALVWNYDPSFGASVIRFQGPGEEDVSYSEFLQAGTASQPIAIEGVQQSTMQVLSNYVEAGFLHVLPLGLDHILFVVGLFLLSPRLRPLLWQVSAFTLAHTITLALGATGTVELPSAPVEFLIAASIAYVAIENLFTSRLRPWRPALVFGFGLLHGLGFAGVLAEFGLPQEHFVLALVAFNIGVEIAQLTVIGLCFVAVGWAMNRTWYRAGVVAPASLGITAMAFYWMLERGGLLA
jgi:hypothetical protein